MLNKLKAALRASHQREREIEEARARVSDELAAADAEVERLRGALRQIVNTLGTGSCGQCKCEGCDYEMGEAAQIAHDALGLPYTVTAVTHSLTLANVGPMSPEMRAAMRRDGEAQSRRGI